LLKLPFCFHYQGLITNSDNAVEALQSVDIQVSKKIPFMMVKFFFDSEPVVYRFFRPFESIPSEFFIRSGFMRC